jgi:hypothetical protein
MLIFKSANADERFSLEIFIIYARISAILAHNQVLKKYFDLLKFCLILLSISGCRCLADDIFGLRISGLQDYRNQEPGRYAVFFSAFCVSWFLVLGS